MSISVHCDRCGGQFTAKNEYAGARTKCPKCGQPLFIPYPTQDEGVTPDINDLVAGWAREDVKTTQTPSARGSVLYLLACPACGQLLDADAVLCSVCGYDVRMGERPERTTSSTCATVSTSAAVSTPAGDDIEPPAEKARHLFSGAATVGASVLGIALAFVPLFVLWKYVPGGGLVLGASFGIAFALGIGAASLWLACRALGEETLAAGTAMCVVLATSAATGFVFFVCTVFGQSIIWASAWSAVVGALVFVRLLNVAFVKAILVYILYCFFVSAISVSLVLLVSLVGKSAGEPLNHFAVVQWAREATQQAQAGNHMKQIVAALLSYESAEKSLPARASFDHEAKPLLSWRVHILPYLAQKSLYEQFHLDEPWDSKHNKQLIPSMPEIFRNPSSAARPGMANYLAVCGKGLAFDGDEGRKMSDFKARYHRILVVEADDNRAVPWTKPDDWQYDDRDPLGGLGAAHAGGFNVGFTDGRVGILSKSMDPKVFQTLLTIDDGEWMSPERGYIMPGVRVSKGSDAGLSAGEAAKEP